MHMIHDEDAKRAQEAADNMHAAWMALLLVVGAIALVVFGIPAMALLR